MFAVGDQKAAVSTLSGRQCLSLTDRTLSDRILREMDRYIAILMLALTKGLMAVMCIWLKASRRLRGACEDHSYGRWERLHLVRP